MKAGDVVQLRVESLGYEGIGIARLGGGDSGRSSSDGLVVQLRGGLPGECVRARICRRKRSYLEANVVEVLEPSPYRRTPPCPYAGECGGCTWQHLAYAEQLRWKEQHIRDAFERIGHCIVEEYCPIIPSPAEFGYRAKMEFSCSARRWIPAEQWESMEPVAIERKQPAVGLHVRGRHDAVLDIERCLLLDERGNALLAAVRELVTMCRVRCDDQRERSGFLRNVIIRRSGLGESMLILITRSPSEGPDRLFLDRCVELGDRFPDVQSIVWCINDTLSPVPPGPFRVLSGRDHIREHIAGIEFRISAQSFFQANVPNLERFVLAVLDATNIAQCDVVWDLYAGTGTLTLPLARRCAYVIGIENNRAATTDAAANAARNGITNVAFITADLHDRTAWGQLDALPNPSVVVLDPPRAGMHPDLTENLRRRLPQRIVYVSCNPTTQARDIGVLQKEYRVVAVQPIDMFPQTYHVESIAVLERR